MKMKNLLLLFVWFLRKIQYVLSKLHRIVYDFDHFLKAFVSPKHTITYYSVLRNIVLILIPFLFMKLFTVFVLAIHSIDFIKWGSIFLQAATFSTWLI